MRVRVKIPALNDRDLSGWLTADTMIELRRKFEEWRDRHGLGASEIGSEFVVCRVGSTDRIGVIYYNGTFKGEDMSKPPLATLPANASKADRQKAIAEAAARKKTDAPPAPKPDRPVAAEKPAPKPTASPPKSDGLLSVSDIARELGVDPKRARARLRAEGRSASEGRWPKVAKGSKEYDQLVAILKPKAGDE